MIDTVKIKDIIIKENRRAIKEETVISLMESIRAVGLLNPITITNLSELIAGRHRLEACKRLGWVKIDVNTIGGGVHEYELAEIDENLLRNEIHYTERGDLFVRRDELLVEIGIRAKQGDNRYTIENDRGVMSTPLKTNLEIAKEAGISKSTYMQDKQISKNVVPEVKEMIRENNIPKTEALKIARLEPEKQIEVAQKIAKQEIKKVDDVLIKEPTTDIKEQKEREELIEGISTCLLYFEKSPYESIRMDCKKIKNFINNLRN